jgi:hypothetical protein
MEEANCRSFLCYYFPPIQLHIKEGKILEIYGYMGA